MEILNLKIIQCRAHLNVFSVIEMFKQNYMVVILLFQHNNKLNDIMSNTVQHR